MMYGIRCSGQVASVLQQIGIFVVDGTHDDGAGHEPTAFNLHI